MTERNFSTQMLGYFDGCTDELLNDLSGLIAIPSVRDLSTKSDNAPFGQSIRKAFDYLIDWANREGFEVRDHQGYALDISYGEGEEDIGILHHVDVVPAGDEATWVTHPFQLHQQGDLVFGRGVTDNKGPLMASLYILKMFKQLNIPMTHKIRVIIGGAEETTWECVEHYFRHQPQPAFGFSPDGDFPIVNGEKGILYAELQKDFPTLSDLGACQIYRIESERDRTSTCHHLSVWFSGQEAASVAQRFNSVAEVTKQKELYRVVLTTPWEKSRNSHRVQNCMDKFMAVMRHVKGVDANSKSLIDLLESCFAGSIDGAKLGLAHMDVEMGGTSCCVSSINLDEHGYNLDFDFRFPKGLTIEETRTRLQHLSQKYGVSFTEQQYLPLSYLSPESDLIQAMGKAYSEVTGMEAQCFSKGAASYARALNNGVAFGPTFPGDVTKVHEPNEQLSLESLRKAITIYVKVLISLQE
ncbi:Sapep family Mn(2+)-dependent dipeptidase (plasmid) [Photobacterium sp. DA100]|uniref:Sapep family Mn(2+)-dependent dipeptidase n=1 Tax=Photobacterium sp. DA100 TaxID=3027472 RepID=UPI00247913A0|nr:Sapep family Mn(2+)-dependent dipeptidase [Photobacterium sp. DA100]WEM45045.1 Sapep family Mn(2+)-dependent dipeptidase [Photobacterium sp. DA100]